jgi:hypothetical protein
MGRLLLISCDESAMLDVAMIDELWMFGYDLMTGSVTRNCTAAVMIDNIGCRIRCVRTQDRQFE